MWVNFDTVVKGVLTWWKDNWEWCVPVAVVVFGLVGIFALVVGDGKTEIADEVSEGLEVAEIADFGPVQVYRMYDRGAVCYLARDWVNEGIALDCLPMVALVDEHHNIEWMRD